MASRLNPYLSFAGNARQAMEFYKSVFGGEVVLNTFGEFGGAEQPDAIMHGILETPSGYTIMGADSPTGDAPKQGDNITVSLSGDDAAELRGHWDKLSDGGSISVPFEKQMWGDEFGMCVDKFGIPWMINVSAASA
jgi:PhnB protein